MQTFLPYADFAHSMVVLDYKRLGKQRVEAKQILDALEKGPSAPWYNHPAVQMWKGYEECLKLYYAHCLIEWTMRGYENNMQFPILKGGTVSKPWWLGVEKFHRAMRARLIAKAPGIYHAKFPDDLNYNDGQYFWPKNHVREFVIINNDRT